MPRKTLCIAVICAFALAAVVGVWICCRRASRQPDLDKVLYDRLFTLKELGPCVLVTQTYSNMPKSRMRPPGVLQPMQDYLDFTTNLFPGMTYFPGDHHVGDPDEAVKVGVEVTRNVPDPSKPGNVLLDFEFRATDETLVVTGVSWNQKDFVAVARGSYWAAFLTSRGEAEVSQ